MVTGMNNIIDFTNKPTSGDKFDFETKFSGDYVKIIPVDYVTKFQS